jgi:hypothetical protein
MLSCCYSSNFLLDMVSLLWSGDGPAPISRPHITAAKSPQPEAAQTGASLRNFEFCQYLHSNLELNPVKNNHKKTPISQLPIGVSGGSWLEAKLPGVLLTLRAAWLLTKIVITKPPICHADITQTQARRCDRGRRAVQALL